MPGSRQRFRVHEIRRTEKRAPKKRARTALQLASRFHRLVRHDRWLVVAALCTLTVATLVGLALPASSKIAIDYILTDAPGPEALPAFLPRDRSILLWLTGGAMIVIAVVSISVSMWGRWQMTRLSKRVQVAMRRRVFDHAVRLPLHRVHELKSGGTASILREDAGAVADLLFSMVYNPWRAIVQFVGTLVILAAVDWRLLLGSILMLPTIWVTHRTWIARIRPMYAAVRNTRTEIDAGATEAFGGMRVVRGFNRQRSEATRFVKANHFMARQELRTWWWARGVEIAWAVLIPTASAAMLVYGGTQVVKGTLTIGDLMMFSAYLLMLLGPLEALVSSATNIQNQLAGFDRVLDLLEEPREFADQTERLPLGDVEGRVTVRGVSFSYPGADRPVLDDIDLDVAPGEAIAFVGASGAGKTTLCNLIARFYDPTGGTILLDGRDLRTIDVEAYRSTLGIVEQDVFLFDGSIRDNIAYGRRLVDEQDVREAARVANALEFIDEFPDGFDTVIGERGVRLSGGQKQRLAIARAVLADPAILMLDEATSSLDTESERLIQASLGILMQGRTSFVIAHRLSTIREADRIVVIEGGRIVEQGTHDELMARSGRYADLVILQTADPHRDQVPGRGAPGS